MKMFTNMQTEMSVLQNKMEHLANVYLHKFIYCQTVKYSPRSDLRCVPPNPKVLLPNELIYHQIRTTATMLSPGLVNSLTKRAYYSN